MLPLSRPTPECGIARIMGTPALQEPLPPCGPCIAPALVMGAGMKPDVAWAPALHSGAIAVSVLAPFPIGSTTGRAMTFPAWRSGDTGPVEGMNRGAGLTGARSGRLS